MAMNFTLGLSRPVQQLGVFNTGTGFEPRLIRPEDPSLHPEDRPYTLPSSQLGCWSLVGTGTHLCAAERAENAALPFSEENTTYTPAV